VDQHPHPGDALAHPVDVGGQEAVVDRAVATPQQHLGRPGPFGVEAAVDPVRVPDHAVGLGQAHGQGGVAAQVLVGRNSTRSARSNAQAMAVAAFEDVQMAPPSRPVKALIAAEEFM